MRIWILRAHLIVPTIGSLGGSLIVYILSGTTSRKICGQDQAIFCNSQLNKSGWVIDAESVFIQKDSGVGIMISSIISRDFGFGINS